MQNDNEYPENQNQYQGQDPNSSTGPYEQNLYPEQQQNSQLWQADPSQNNQQNFAQPDQQNQPQLQTQQWPQNLPAQQLPPQPPNPAQTSPYYAQSNQQPRPASNNGLVVLQWLTYAFWGWTVLAMSFLVTAVVYNFVSGNDNSGFAVFGVASVLILLPISVVCDYFYSKHEPVKKVGAASIIMVIHAVIFALFGIGAMISAVVSAGFLLTSSSDGSASKVGLISSLIIAIFYALVFVRTMFTHKIPVFKRFFIILMVVLVGIIAAMGIFGPVAQERKTRDDKLLSANLSNLDGEINQYASKNKKLPENLSVLNLSGDTKKIVDQNLVRYTPNTKEPVDEATGASASKVFGNTGTTFVFYTVCANFIADSSDNGYGRSYGSDDDGDGYSEYQSYYEYKKGENCFKSKHAIYDSTLDN